MQNVSKVTPKVELLDSTANLEKLVAISAKLCYSNKDIKEITDISAKKTQQLINKLLEIGHESVFEHAKFTFAIEGVSRVFTHQLVRHRIASYSQKSQRYVREGDSEYIVPDRIKELDLEKLYMLKIEEMFRAYNTCADIMIVKLFDADIGKVDAVELGTDLNYIEYYQKHYPKKYREYEKIAIENSRYLLPNATESKIIVTMNVRSLFNFFELRLCNRAQEEIRHVAEKMLEICRKEAPNIFRKAVPKCVYDKCPEGDKTCGNPRNDLKVSI